jgi:hypothetical protein
LVSAFVIDDDFAEAALILSGNRKRVAQLLDRLNLQFYSLGTDFQADLATVAGLKPGASQPRQLNEGGTESDSGGENDEINHAFLSAFARVAYHLYRHVGIP